ncbi:hypothetical protein [Zobellia sp. B3R18]|uniref:hypothetical protein n=1 Tax=Zobellia sp. B3R18 TaxID=2841568 RepID=UPI001C071616|nr:hypothetical protein [Zobellia sp. B3R18]MBU2975641.1 hypothetical protein [Zobellia sp. B3R18]
MTDSYKLIVPNSKNRPNEKVQLFNIYEDPLEQTDIADENPSIVEELKKKIEESWKN